MQNCLGVAPKYLIEILLHFGLPYTHKGFLMVILRMHFAMAQSSFASGTVFHSPQNYQPPHLPSSNADFPVCSFRHWVQVLMPDENADDLTLYKYLIICITYINFLNLAYQKYYEQTIIMLILINQISFKLNFKQFITQLQLK